MDSPPASLPTDRAGRRVEDDNRDSSSLLASRRAKPIRHFYRNLSILVLSMLFSVLFFYSFPFWRPMAVLMLHKLWDIVRFLVLTTSIGLGIINSKSWKGNDTERDSIASDSGKEESASSKVPFMGLFYSELQPSYDYDDKEQEMGGYGYLMSRSDSGNDRVCAASTTSLPAITVADNDDVDKPTKPQNVSNLVTNGISSVSSITVSHTHEGDAKHDEYDRSFGEELPINSCMNIGPMKAKSSLFKSRDDLGLVTVVDNEQPKHSSKVIHRRGNSLEFAIEQEGDVMRHGDTVKQHREGMEAKGGRSTSSKTTSASASEVSNYHLERQADKFSSCATNMDPKMSTSKHSRSQSAYSLKELVHEQGPRRKPGKAGRLSRRRNVSLSCDLDKGFMDGGTSAWAASVPSPPAPPLINASINGVDSSRSGLYGEHMIEGKQDESSLRAYRESLAPWRSATKALPVSIPEKVEGKEKEKERKKNKSMLKESGVETPPSSPSTPGSFMESPSPGELNKKVESFIARFHERMRLQRLESIERSRGKIQ